MRARFIGDVKRGGQGPEAINAFGLDFRKHEWVDVSGLDAVSLRKLTGNDHFEFDGSGKAPAAAPAPAAEAPKRRGRPPKSEAAPAAPAEPDAASRAGDDDWGDLDP